MADKYTIEHSAHHRKRMAEDPGHRYTVEDAKNLIENHEQSGVQKDGRPWFFGVVNGQTVVVAVSAVAVSVAAGVEEVVGRIKTMHRRRKPRKDP